MTSSSDVEPLIVDYIAAAVDLGLKPDTVYRWAKSKVIPTHGTDARRRLRISLDDAERVAHERGLIE